MRESEKTVQIHVMREKETRCTQSECMKCEIWEFWHGETFSRHTVVKHATAAKGGSLMTLERENNAPFPKPWGPQIGCGGRHNIASHFTVVYCHCEPHSSPLPLSGGRRGERGESKGEEKKGGDRYHIALRARSAQLDWSLSCLPLVASWTKHRPGDSLRTLLL